MTNPKDLEHPTWALFDSSKVQTYLDCPRRYFYEYQLGWRTDAPNNDLVFGQAFHDALEYLMTHPMTVDSIEPAYDLFLKRYRQFFSEETDELFVPKSPNNAFLGLCSYVGKYEHQDQFKTLYTELGGRVSVGNHTIVYKIDSVCEDDNGRIFSFEHKTTKWGFKKVWFDEWLLSLQIGAYSYALRCLYPQVKTPLVIVNGIAFSKIKVDCERQPVKKTLNHLNVWLFTINHWISQIKKEMDILCNDCSVDDNILIAFPMRPRACTNYFRLCPYHDFCMAWSNPLSRAFDGPPSGFQRQYWNPLEDLEIKNRIDLKEPENA